MDYKMHKAAGGVHFLHAFINLKELSHQPPLGRPQRRKGTGMRGRSQPSIGGGRRWIIKCTRERRSRRGNPLMKKRNQIYQSQHHLMSWMLFLLHLIDPSKLRANPRIYQIPKPYLVSQLLIAPLQMTAKLPLIGVQVLATMVSVKMYQTEVLLAGLVDVKKVVEGVGIREIME